MYEKILKDYEGILKNDYRAIDDTTKILDIIIKIKTIQAMDRSAELIEESKGTYTGSIKKGY